MKIEKAKKKEEAIARMKMLKLNPNIIQAFEEEDILHLSENGGFLYWLTNKNLMSKNLKNNMMRLSIT